MKKLITVLFGAIFLFQSCDTTTKKELEQCNKENDSLIQYCETQYSNLQILSFPDYFHDITERQAEVLIDDCIGVYRPKLIQYGVSGFIEKDKIYDTITEYSGVNVYFGLDGNDLSLYYRKGHYNQSDSLQSESYYVASDIKRLTSTPSDQKFSTLKGLDYSYVTNSQVIGTTVARVIGEFKAQFKNQNSKDQMFLNKKDINSVFDSIPNAIGLRFFIGYDTSEHDNRLRVIMFPQDSSRLNYLSGSHYRMILERMWP